MGIIQSVKDVYAFPPDKTSMEEIYRLFLKTDTKQELDFCNSEKLFLVLHRYTLLSDVWRDYDIHERIFKSVVRGKWTTDLIHMFADFTFVAHLNKHATRFLETDIYTQKYFETIKEQYGSDVTKWPMYKILMEEGLPELFSLPGEKDDCNANTQSVIDDLKNSRLDGLYWLTKYCQTFPNRVNSLHSKLGISALHIVSSTFGLKPSQLNFNVRAIRLLVNHGADVNQRDRYGATALHYAAANGYTDGCVLLKQLGADTSIRDVNRRTAGDLALIYGNFNCALVCQQFDSLLHGFSECMLCNEERNRLKESAFRYADEYTGYLNAQISHFSCYEAMIAIIDTDSESFHMMHAGKIKVHNVPREADVMTSLVHLRHGSAGDCNKIITSGVVKSITAAIKELIGTVIKMIGNDREFFDIDPKPVVPGGSAQGGKLGLPDEYEVNVVVNSKILLASLCDSDPGYCYLRNLNCIMQVQNIHGIKMMVRELFGRDINKLYENGWTDCTGHLSTAFSSVSETLPRKHIESHDYALNLYWDSSLFKHLQIKVRIAPIIKAPRVLSDEGLLESLDKENMLLSRDIMRFAQLDMQSAPLSQTHHLKETAHLTFTGTTDGFASSIPFYKNKLSDGSGDSCKIPLSYTIEENKTFRLLPDKLKECYGILKSLNTLIKGTIVVKRGSNSCIPGLNIPSCYLKQVIFQMNAMIKKGRIPCDTEVIDLIKIGLKRLEDSLRKKEMCCFFNPQNNLLNSSGTRTKVPEVYESKILKYLMSVLAMKAIVYQKSAGRKKIPLDISISQSHNKLATFDESSL